MNKKIPNPIPPRSIVRLIRAGGDTPDWKEDMGRRFRIGYYSPQDGLDCIWLVNEDAKYEQTCDHEFLFKYFNIERLSRESDLFGVNKAILKPLRKPHSAVPKKAASGRKRK